MTKAEQTEKINQLEAEILRLKNKKEIKRIEFSKLKQDFENEFGEIKAEYKFVGKKYKELIYYVNGKPLTSDIHAKMKNFIHYIIQESYYISGHGRFANPGELVLLLLNSLATKYAVRMKRKKPQ